MLIHTIQDLKHYGCSVLEAIQYMQSYSRTPHMKSEASYRKGSEHTKSEFTKIKDAVICNWGN